MSSKKSRSRPARPAASRQPRSVSASPATLGIPVCNVPMWTRVVRIHALVNRDERYNADDLARELETSYRSIMRTVEFMRDQLGLPIVADRGEKFYRFTEPCPFLPQVRVDADEDLVLRLMRCLFPALVGSHGDEACERVLQKFAALTGGHGSFASARRPAVLCPTTLPAAGEFAHLSTIHHAIEHRQELKLLYRSSLKAKPATRVVRPLDLAVLKQRWVLVLLDADEKQTLRTFRLDRIQAVALRGVAFTPPADLDIARRLAGNLGCYTGTEDHEVRIRLCRFAADDALTCAWHPSQKLVTHTDGTVEITLRLNNLVEIVHDILYWGAQAEALSPPALREAVRQEQRTSLAQYEA